MTEMATSTDWTCQLSPKHLSVVSLMEEVGLVLGGNMYDLGSQ